MSNLSLTKPKTERFFVVDCSNINSFLKACDRDISVIKRKYAGEVCRICWEEGEVAGEEKVEEEKEEKEEVVEEKKVEKKDVCNDVYKDENNENVNGNGVQTPLAKPAPPKVDPFANFNPMMLMFSRPPPPAPAEDQDEVLIEVCRCTKIMRVVHESCLVKEINERLNDNCKHCGDDFVTTHDTSRPFYKWRFGDPAMRDGQACTLMGCLLLMVVLGALVALVVDVLLNTGIVIYASVPLVGTVVMTYVLGVCAATMKARSTIQRIWILNCPTIGVYPLDKLEEQFL